MKIKNDITINFLIVFVLVVSVIIILINYFSVKIVKDEILFRLFSVVNLEKNHIETILEEKKENVKILATEAIIVDLLEQSRDLQHPLVENEDIMQNISNQFRELLAAREDFIDISILNNFGKVIISSDLNKEIGQDFFDEDFFNEARNSTYVRTIYIDEQLDEKVYDISMPIYALDGKDFLGVIVVKINAGDLKSLISDAELIGDTEDIFIVDCDGYYLTAPKKRSVEILKDKIVDKHFVGCSNQSFYSYEEESVDYKNKNFDNVESYGDIIRVHSYISETGWYLVAEIKEIEVTQSIKKINQIIVAIAMGSMFIFYLMSQLVARRITKPIEKLSQSINSVKKGNFEKQISIKGQDEISDLADEFNQMLKAIVESRETVDKKVEEQTAEINIKKEDLENQKIAILNVLDDVSLEKIKTEKLVGDLKKFKLAVDSASDHIVIADSEEVIIYANKAALKMTGFRTEEMLGKQLKSCSLWRSTDEKKSCKNIWNSMKRDKKVFAGEVKNKRKNGEEYDSSISLSPVLGKNNEIIFVVDIERDITKEKEIDRAKTEFVSLASHQLRTPLSAINWYTEMLLTGDAGKITKAQKDYLEEVYNGSKRMVNLVNALLNVSRIDLGTFAIEPKEVNLIDISDEIIKELQPQIKSKGLKIEKKYDSKMGKIKVDSKLLSIIFQNLISNAVKYTPEKGKIEVKIKVNKPNVLIEISDNGFGIPKKQQSKIFTKLFRADNVREKETDGTGLGLYIAKSIIEKSGGKIWFKSKEDKGTSFFVEIPLSGMKKRKGNKELT